MIHFDFIVDDTDAENIMQIMQGAINKCDIEIIELMVSNDNKAEIEWFREHKKYLKELGLKMKNTRYESPQKT